ncbi:hypothetical protein ABES03_09645 [Neobacillus rhizosphaerae]|uniref:hypothetical protein n=1 Tax=Neobacillus rhizosphaerae TaxID=2880965 RepID=UPI003D277D02
MLTPAQQKVKQELEELQVKATIQRRDEEPAPNKSPKKTWFYILAGICMVIISSLLLLDSSTANQEEIVSFLKIEQSYNKRSTNLFINITEKDPPNLQRAVVMQAELLQKANNLKAPASLSVHKQDLLKVMQQRLDLLTYLAEEENRNEIQVNKKLLELKVSREIAIENLTTALDKAEIKYTQEKDGMIQYWVDSKVYQYSF